LTFVLLEPVNSLHEICKMNAQWSGHFCPSARFISETHNLHETKL